MSTLLIELWHLVFDHLDLVDLSTCALVNKKLYFAVKDYRIRELAFTRRTKTKWFHSDHSDYQNQIDYSMAAVLKRSSFNFDFLKRLKIGRLSSIDLNEINKFTQLEELDIDLKNYENREAKILRLAHLKVLVVFASSRIPFLELDTPCLAKVCTFSLKRLDFLHPESVRCIHTFAHNRKLSAFRNLEYLLFTNYYNRLDFSGCDPLGFKEFSLTNVKRVKEIDFYFTYYFSDRQHQLESLNNFKQIISKILDLKRPDLKVFWRSVQITNTDLLTEYSDRKCAAKLVVLHFQHYEKLKKHVDHFWAYDFNLSTRKLQKANFDTSSAEFVSKFFAKYSLRKLLVFNRVDEQALLLEFISRSPNLFALEFSKTHLDQTFFDRMADLIQLNGIPLQTLRFEKSSDEPMNFRFVTKLLHLELLSTDLKMPADMLPKLLRLPLLAEIAFSSGECRIERTSTGGFRLNGKLLSLRELLKHFGCKSQSIVSNATMWSSTECSLM